VDKLLVKDFGLLRSCFDYLLRAEHHYDSGDWVGGALRRTEIKASL